MRLQNEPKLKRFGLFKMTPRITPRGDEEREERLKRFMEDIVKKIDLEYPRQELPQLNYHLSAILSIINDPLGKINKDGHGKTMNNRVRRCYEYLSKELIAVRGHIMFDHIFWYDDEDGNLVIESHPYGILGNKDFELFVRAREKYPDLEIRVRPDSHYFANHTLYIKFIIKNPSEFLKQANKWYKTVSIE